MNDPAPMSVTRTSLVERYPAGDPRDLLAGFVPGPRFADVSFDSYLPDPAQPTQAAAVAALRKFAGAMDAAPRGFWGRLGWGRSGGGAARAGIYLDGGFGVGKTHLLASLFHAARGRAAFGTFVEYTNLAGALGFRQAVEALSGYGLVCIDEFELDDPGDTVLMSRMMRELADAGVKLAATSNTLPGALGEGRFAAVDFTREIQVLADQFEVVRIDGEDYRHRGLPAAPQPYDDASLEAAVEGWQGRGVEVAVDRFDALMDHLRMVHPSRYRALLDGVGAVAWEGVHELSDQAVALRLVVLVDRLYDADIPILASGLPLDRVFTEEMLQGGYQKKYFRAVSRATALARNAMEAS